MRLRRTGHRPRYRGAFGGVETWGTHRAQLKPQRCLLWLGRDRKARWLVSLRFDGQKLK
jgi:hypothetical protein